MISISHMHGEETQASNPLKSLYYSIGASEQSGFIEKTSTTYMATCDTFRGVRGVGEKASKIYHQTTIR